MLSYNRYQGQRILHKQREVELKKVLLIDDMPGILEQAHEMMDGKYELITASGLDDALGALKDEKPDLVLTDMYIENDGAFELLKKIRGGKENTSIPVLFTGCDVSVMSLSKIFSLGASDFVKKPFVENILFKKMEEQMKLSEIGYRYDK